MAEKRPSSSIGPAQSLERQLSGLLAAAAPSDGFVGMVGALKAVDIEDDIITKIEDTVHVKASLAFYKRGGLFNDGRLLAGGKWLVVVPKYMLVVKHGFIFVGFAYRDAEGYPVERLEFFLSNRDPQSHAKTLEALGWKASREGPSIVAVEIALPAAAPEAPG